MNDKLTRIGVFYDGNYFYKVSNFYNFTHSQKKRISIGGLHKFIISRVAREEKEDEKLCQIVDAHYFRGRIPAKDAREKENQLYYDRVFDDILSSEGVSTHYLPLKPSFGSGNWQEKGIDVWLALEAYELAFYKRFSVLALIACDGDFLPLVRKLNTLGTRVMLLSWDLKYQQQDGKPQETRTSQDLIDEVSYYLPMHKVIDDGLQSRASEKDRRIDDLFVS